MFFQHYTVEISNKKKEGTFSLFSFMVFIIFYSYYRHTHNKIKSVLLSYISAPHYKTNGFCMNSNIVWDRVGCEETWEIGEQLWVREVQSGNTGGRSGSKWGRSGNPARRSVNNCGSEKYNRGIPGMGGSKWGRSRNPARRSVLLCSRILLCRRSPKTPFRRRRLVHTVSYQDSLRELAPHRYSYEAW